MKRFLRLLISGTVCLLVVVGFSIYQGQQLLAPVPRIIGPPPDHSGGETIRFQSKSGNQIAGWLTETEKAAGAVLLLHGIRADRRSMVGRAKFLSELGYHTLAIDLQAHGESTGNQITLGQLEAMDAAAGVAYLQSRYEGTPVAVIGTSLGGAAALIADYEHPPEAMVLEAVFADIETSIANRLEIRFGRLGRRLTPLATWPMKPLFDIDVSQLNSVRAAEFVFTPVLVIYGSEDRRARPAESKTLYAALQGPKQIWEVKGAAHVDFHGVAKEEYEKRVAEFIATHLHPEKEFHRKTIEVE